jgi:hypothetical protein
MPSDSPPSRSATFVALIGALGVVLGAVLGYFISEKQYQLEHKKFIGGLIITLGQTNVAKGLARYLAASGAFGDDAIIICNTFEAGPPHCPPLPK